MELMELTKNLFQEKNEVQGKGWTRSHDSGWSLWVAKPRLKSGRYPKKVDMVSKGEMGE